MDNRQIASWIVPLVGHQFDLEDLPFWLAGQAVHVAPRDNTFVLVIPSAVVGDNHEPVRVFAEGQLALINGIGRLMSSTYRPISLADKLFGLDSAGVVLNTVVAVNSGEMRSKGGSVRALVGGKVQMIPLFLVTQERT